MRWIEAETERPILDSELACWRADFFFAPRGQHTQALEAAELAVQADPDDALCVFTRGTANSSLGRCAKAVADFEAALRTSQSAELIAMIEPGLEEVRAELARLPKDASTSGGGKTTDRIKITCGGKTTKLQPDCSLDDLLAKIALIHKVPKDSISLSYVDQDGDDVGIADDGDLEDAKKRVREGKVTLGYSSAGAEADALSSD